MRCPGLGCIVHLLRLFFFNDPATTELYTLPYTTLFRSASQVSQLQGIEHAVEVAIGHQPPHRVVARLRSEEHTSELQSLTNLVCRLLLEKKKRTKTQKHP